jgi:hypothetical protein
MMKKNIKIKIVSLSIGRADITATISTLRPLTLEIDFNGLNTLKVLKPDTLRPPDSYSGPG